MNREKEKKVLHLIAMPLPSDPVGQRISKRQQPILSEEMEKIEEKESEEKWKPLKADKEE